MKNNEKQRFYVSLVIFVILAFMYINFFIKIVEFDVNCEQYLMRSANAPTVEIATQDLERAIEYLEIRKLTSGNTSLLIYSPKNDIGHWYENLKASLKELKDVSNSTYLEKSNVLLKLKRTLLKEENKVVKPSNIEFYPHKVSVAILLYLPIGVLFIGVIGFIVFMIITF